MKKSAKNLILFLMIIANVNCAFCYTLTKEELKADILAKVTPQIKSQLADYTQDIKISIQGLSNQPIVTNENTKPKIEIISQNNSFNQNSYKRIIIKNSMGNVIKAFPINVQTQIFATVLTASDNIAFNQSINQNNTKLERKDITRYLGKTYSAQVNGIIAKRNYQKGNIIIADFTKAKSSVLRNSSIDIVFQSKGLNIRLRGKALKDGAIGDTILVRSDKYNRTYTGVVQSENEVMVRI